MTGVGAVAGPVTPDEPVPKRGPTIGARSPAELVVVVLSGSAVLDGTAALVDELSMMVERPTMMGPLDVAGAALAVSGAFSIVLLGAVGDTVFGGKPPVDPVPEAGCGLKSGLLLEEDAVGVTMLCGTPPEEPTLDEVVKPRRLETTPPRLGAALADVCSLGAVEDELAVG